ncbi:class II glutamine amidotransferase [Pseudonocardia sp. Cha107L01]|jgi:glutamate synthase domain-containing protein 1|uniref:class II glutamine amidotransferase n=1 Tax=Pseudonocardia sp. Cha107L01 TaxID=3457576 RepID=UPI00403ECC03
MCGIVGLHLKSPELQPRLGELLVPMLEAMTSRGPDSAGVALYDDAGMTVIKDVGRPREICERNGVALRAGYQAAGHTRMATESAVTTEGAHPFTPLPDLALVHNGSFSNHASVRRQLAYDGIECTTENDSEVAARFIGRELSNGADLADAMRMVLKEFDGFFTLLVTTANQFAVLRDSFACKPAVIAETDGYVAMASEFHALAELPGISTARIFEPEPETVYAWSR